MTTSRHAPGQIARGLLHGNALLRNLPEDEVECLLPGLQQTVLLAGREMIRTNQPIRSAYFPLGGLLSLLTQTGPSEVSEVGVIGADGVLGATGALAVPPCIPWVVRARSDCTALRLPVELLHGSAARLPELTRRCGIFLELLLFQISQTAACNGRHSLACRLSRWLLHCIDRSPDDTMPLTQSFLAGLLAVRRAGVTVTANRLRNRGLIEIGRGRMTVLDRHGLEEVACGCYAMQRKREAAALAMMEAGPKRP